MRLQKLRLSVAKLAMSGFDAASTTISRIRNWNPPNTEINTLLVADGNLMRARARKLDRENSYAKGALDCYVANAIGSGIVPRSTHPDEGMRKRIETSFDRWSKECDANGMQDFYGLQATACRALRRDGEVFARKRFRRASDKLHVPFQIQLLEADHVPYWKNEVYNNGYTRAGIQFDLVGKRDSYWMYRDHPGSSWIHDATLYQIPADQILHCFEVQRPGQLRGQPWMTAAIVLLYDIKQLQDASLLRQKVVNLLSVWIKRGSTTGGILNETNNGDGTGIAGLTPGSVNYLNKDEEPSFLDPKDAGVGFADFINSMLRGVARALGITFEQLTGDLSKVNYSSIRAGLLEFRRACEAFQYQVMVHQFCGPLWKPWMDQAITAGVLGDGAEAAYRENPDDFLGVVWTPPGWPWVNPKEDVAALREAIRGGLSSRARVVSENGESVQDIDAENAADNERADKLGLKYDSDGRNPAAGPHVTETTTVPDDGSNGNLQESA